MPAFSEDLRAPAVEALDRIMGDEFGLAESWVAAAGKARERRAARAILGRGRRS